MHRFRRLSPSTQFKLHFSKSATSATKTALMSLCPHWSVHCVCMPHPVPGVDSDETTANTDQNIAKTTRFVCGLETRHVTLTPTCPGAVAMHDGGEHLVPAVVPLWRFEAMRPRPHTTGGSMITLHNHPTPQAGTSDPARPVLACDSPHPANGTATTLSRPPCTSSFPQRQPSWKPLLSSDSVITCSPDAGIRP